MSEEANSLINIYDGFKGEEKYRKDLINTIKETKLEDISNISNKLDYGFSDYDLIRLSEGYKQGDKLLQNKIIELLTDCNFHSEASMLLAGEADKLVSELKDEILNYYEKNINDAFSWVSDHIDKDDYNIFCNVLKITNEEFENPSLIDTNEMEDVLEKSVSWIDDHILDEDRKNLDGYLKEELYDKTTENIEENQDEMEED